MMFSAFMTLTFKCLLDLSKIEIMVEASNDHITDAEIYLAVNGIYIR